MSGSNGIYRFLRKLCFPECLYHFTFPSSCLHILAGTWCGQSFSCFHSGGSIVADHCGLVFLVIHDDEHLFMCLLAISISYFVRYVHSYYLFPYWLVCIIIFKLWEFFIHSEYRSFVWCMCCKCFLLLCGMPFVF